MEQCEATNSTNRIIKSRTPHKIAGALVVVVAAASLGSCAREPYEGPQSDGPWEADSPQAAAADVLRDAAEMILCIEEEGASDKANTDVSGQDKQPGKIHYYTDDVRITLGVPADHPVMDMNWANRPGEVEPGETVYFAPESGQLTSEEEVHALFINRDGVFADEPGDSEALDIPDASSYVAEWGNDVRDSLTALAEIEGLAGKCVMSEVTA